MWWWLFSYLHLSNLAELYTKRLIYLALAGWLSRLEHCPVHQKVNSSIAGWVMLCMGGSWLVFLSHINVSLSLSPTPSFLSKINKKHFLGWGKKWVSNLHLQKFLKYILKYYFIEDLFWPQLNITSAFQHSRFHFILLYFSHSTYHHPTYCIIYLPVMIIASPPHW